MSAKVRSKIDSGLPVFFQAQPVQNSICKRVGDVLVHIWRQIHDFFQRVCCPKPPLIAPTPAVPAPAATLPAAILDERPAHRFLILENENPAPFPRAEYYERGRFSGIHRIFKYDVQPIFYFFSEEDLIDLQARIEGMNHLNDEEILDQLIEYPPPYFDRYNPIRVRDEYWDVAVGLELDLRGLQQRPWPANNRPSLQGWGADESRLFHVFVDWHTAIKEAIILNAYDSELDPWRYVRDARNKIGQRWGLGYPDQRVDLPIDAEVYHDLLLRKFPPGAQIHLDMLRILDHPEYDDLIWRAANEMIRRCIPEEQRERILLRNFFNEDNDNRRLPKPQLVAFLLKHLGFLT